MLCPLRFDCGSGLVTLTSKQAMRLGEWNTVVLHRRASKGWLQLNGASMVKARSPVSALPRWRTEWSGAADQALTIHVALTASACLLSNVVDTRNTRFQVELGQTVSIWKYRGATRYRYRTFKVSKYQLTTGWFIFNVIPGYQEAIALKYDR